MTLDNSVLNYAKGKQAKKADCTVTLQRSTMDEIFTGKTTLAKAITAGEARIDGNAKALQDVLACLDSFEFWFDIITANPPPKK